MALNLLVCSAALVALASSASALAFDNSFMFNSCPATAVGCSNNPITNMPYDECCVAGNGLLVYSQNWTAGLWHNAKPGQTTWVSNETISNLPKNAWTVHGLWPDYCNGNYNSSNLGCDPSRVYEDVQSRLDAFTDAEPTFLQNMYTYWLAGDGDYNWFWSHEWTKHATCFSPLKPSCMGDAASNNGDVLEFFKISMDLRFRFPIYDIFANASIVPSTSQVYYRQNFSDALTAATGARGGVQCVKDAAGDQYLSEIYIYLLSHPNLQFDVASPDLVNYNDTTGANHRDFQSCNAAAPIYYWPQDAFPFLA